MSETLCQCGHTRECHDTRLTPPIFCTGSGECTCVFYLPPPTREPISLTDEEQESLRREAYRQLYPGHVNTHDSKRTRESDLREADRAYLIWDEKRAGYAPTSIINELIERLAPTVESILAARLAGGPTLADAREQIARELQARADYIQNGASAMYTQALRDAAQIVLSGELTLTKADARTPESEDTE